MPEGPEVKLITLFLHQQVKSLYLSWVSPIEHDDKSKYLHKSSSFRQVCGKVCQVNKVFCRGKQIFFQLDTWKLNTYHLDDSLADILKKKGQYNRLYLNSTLGTEGKWVFEGQHSVQVNNVDKSIANPKHSNLWLNLTNGCEKKVLYFNDVRHQGNFFVFTEEEFNVKWNKIGPSYLDETISWAEYKAVISRKRLAQKQICDFLLAQQYFSGIGNYLKAEILYDCRIRPDRQLGELTKKEQRMLWKTSIYLIQEAYAAGGKTLRSFYHPDGQTGQFQVLVYGKTHDPKDNKVRRDTFKDKRTTHWVPAIQK